jgi:hypothetical protein
VSLFPLSHFVLSTVFTKILYALNFVPKLTYVYGVICLLVCVLLLGWLLIFFYFVEVALLYGEFGYVCSFGSGGGFYGWWVIKRVSKILLGKKVWSSLR